MKTTTAIILDIRRPKADGKYPVKLRVTYQRKQKYYSTDIDLLKEDFKKANSDRPRGEFKDLKLVLSQIEINAKRIIDDMPDFSFGLFEKHFQNPRFNHKDVFLVYENYINKLNSGGRIGTACSYKCSLNSLKKYSKSLTFDEITESFLKGYENWMIEDGNSLTTVGIYLRALRTLVNEAKQLKVINEEQYPFGKWKYQIPSGRNIKKALSLSDIEKIYNYPAYPGSSEEKAKDFWLFSYMVNGLNMKDIAKLTYKNIEGDKLIFIRSKTKRTTRQNQKPIVAIIIDDAKRIIEKWGVKPPNPESYIFTILPNKVISPQREYELIKQFIKNINKWIRRLAIKVGIDKDVTTYTARHSFSTILKRSGASTEYISEALGHSNLQTTENYLDSFEDNVKREYAEILVDFKKNE